MRVPSIVLIALCLVTLASPWLPLQDPGAQDRLRALQPPSSLHWLGTDAFGRDEFSRLLNGGRISLAAGMAATVIALTLALLVGACSGYRGGWTDILAMRAAELFQSLPWLYLLLGVRALLPLTLPPEQTFLVIAGLLGVVGWAKPASLIRGVVLTVREREYVTAARAFGAGDFYLLRRHILPATHGVLLTQAALLMPRFILAEVTMSFLGLGAGEPLASWGNMLIALRDVEILRSCWWMLAPGVMLAITVFCCNSIAQSLAGAGSD